ncbi:hypothetical protein RHGRI_024327 [Rhododendron griersonianum]|uniref:Uncharacterized protein n=1 Tax=Rhododendron griersonianum TaxID=479676 RepID=A0AAV6JAL0_9ERIC|nr:hypothetical protein RHGRI_024327 [Rhododendron griersonianum]
MVGRDERSELEAEIFHVDSPIPLHYLPIKFFMTGVVPLHYHPKQVTDRDNFRAKFKILESQLQETDAEVEKLKKELAEAKTVASSAEAEVEKMKKEEKEKLRQADAKGYEAGIQRAALEYTQTAHKNGER